MTSARSTQPFLTLLPHHRQTWLMDQGALQLSPNVSSEALQGWLHEEKTQSRLHICKAREHMRAEPRVSSKKTAGNLLLCIDQQVVRARE